MYRLMCLLLHSNEPRSLSGMQCPKTVLPKMSAASYRWLCPFKLTKIKQEIQLFGHNSHILGAQKIAQIEMISIIEESSFRQRCSRGG